MHMGTPTVLPPKPSPVVSGTNDSNVEDLDKRHNSVVEEPICDGLALNDCLGMGSP